MGSGFDRLIALACTHPLLRLSDLAYNCGCAHYGQFYTHMTSRDRRLLDIVNICPSSSPT